MKNIDFQTFILLGLLVVSAGGASGPAAAAGGQVPAQQIAAGGQAPTPLATDEDMRTEAAVLRERMGTLRVEHASVIDSVNGGVARIEMLYSRDAEARRAEMADLRADMTELKSEMHTEIAQMAVESARREIRIILFIIALLAVYPFYLGVIRRYAPNLLP